MLLVLDIQDSWAGMAPLDILVFSESWALVACRVWPGGPSHRVEAGSVLQVLDVGWLQDPAGGCSF